MDSENLKQLLLQILEQMPEKDEKSSKARDRFQRNLDRLKKYIDANKLIKVPEIINSILRNINEIRMITRGKVGSSNICSVVEYPDRGGFGDNTFRGNTTGFLLLDLFQNPIFKPTYVLDPMEGSGTTGDVCRYLGIKYVGLDLLRGFNLLEDPLPDDGFDFIFFHPPYYNIIKYYESYDDKQKQEVIKRKDLSGFIKYEDYLRALRKCIDRLMEILVNDGYLTLLIGDVRKEGMYKCIFNDLDKKGLTLKYLLIKIQHNMTSLGYNYYGHPFIPIAHEFVPIFQK